MRPLTSRGGGEHVPLATHRSNRARGFGVERELLTQARDLDVDQASERLELSAAHERQQLLAREWTTWPLGERVQEVELRRRQDQGIAGDVNLSRALVDHQIAELN